MKQFNIDVHAAKQNNNERQQSEDNAQINRHITPLKHIYFNIYWSSFVILIHNQSHKIINKRVKTLLFSITVVELINK